MPQIPDIFRDMERFRYTTTVNLNMGYYSMPLSEQAKKLCIISLPWDLYQYNYLPQGLKPAMDIFQQRMGALFYNMPVVIVYMEDGIIFGCIYISTHLVNITEVLWHLSAAEMQVNPDKCLGFHPAKT
jgi:hypothetical protein